MANNPTDEIDRSIPAIIARLRYGDSDGDDHDMAAAELERLIARVKWLEDWKDACEDTIARLNRKALHSDVPRDPAPRREHYEPGDYGQKCYEKALLEHSTRTNEP